MMTEIHPSAGSVLGIPLAGLTQALRWAVLPAFAVGAVPALDVATGGHRGATFMAALADPLSVLAARSPGARASGALTQTKPRRDRDERVLAEALTRPLRPTDAPGVGGAVPEAPGLVAPDVPVAEIGPGTVAPAVVEAGDVVPGPLPASYFPGSGITVVPDLPGGGGIGGGGGGGTPTTPDVSIPTTPGTPVASVPEPATWGTLLLGFGAIGGGLRWRRRPVERRA